MIRASLPLILVAVVGCGGRSVLLAADAAPSGLEGLDGLAGDPSASDAGVDPLDDFCQGTAPKLVVNGKPVPSAYSPSHAKSTGSAGPLQLSIQLRDPAAPGVAYYLELSSQQHVSSSFVLDLAAIPSSSRVTFRKTYCSVGGTDACQILGTLDSKQGDSFAGSAQVEGSLTALTHATFCLVGRPRSPSTQQPEIAVQLHLSKQL